MMAGEAEYAFRHALVRDVAYAQLPRASRAEKHRLAAELDRDDRRRAGPISSLTTTASRLTSVAQPAQT